ncbi:PH-domain-containing protein [Rhizoclosmatium globosum]|uniref:PH-domain-containing protein n=1 Tax=Rhizoclosmatium globosum TaxID=329046 RepID=A0A1Y2CSR1_9FUNG|nr:PH-domain-containing protein [Rhizoclosmatium globosum]|eukprot:ORY50041.1 PH-domain-containing protein [Rhizoclosmatium globosum]
MNDFSLNLVASFTAHRRLSILGDTSVLDSFADALKTVCSLNAQMAEDLTENLTYPLQHYLREEIKELREHRKNHDRVTANYDAALVKYSQLPKNKESSALTEDSFICLRRKSVHPFELELCGPRYFIQEQDDLLFRTADEIISYKNALEEEALSIARPRLEDKAPGSRSESPNANLKESPPNKAGSGNGRVPPLKEATVLPSSLTLPGAALSPQQPIEIEGYLFKKNEKKVWIRRYFMIKKGSMFYANTYPTGKMRGVVLSTDSLNLALFSVRVDTVEDRRFVFEVYAGKKSYKLQAESERDMHDWINVFEAAKAAALKPSAVSLPLPAEIKLANANASQASSTGPSALAGEEEVDEIMSENKTHVIHENSDDDEHEPEDDDDDEQDESAIHMEEVGGDTAATESGKAVAVFADVNVNYPDKTFEQKNKELHKLLKSVPPSDFVIDAFAIFLQRANLIQGKIYVTQNRICFYSNIMGIISVLVIHLKEITNITRAKHGLYKCINIETTKAPD